MQCDKSSHVVSLSNYFWEFVHSSVLNTGSITSQYVASSLWRLSWCRSRHTWRWESRVLSFPRLSSSNFSPNSVLLKALFFSVVGLCSRMYWHRIAAAAAAAFREGQVLTASWRHKFPDARLRIHLRFNVVRFLWSLLVIFHGMLWRFATLIIEVFFLFAQ